LSYDKPVLCVAHENQRPMETYFSEDRLLRQGLGSSLENLVPIADKGAIKDVLAGYRLEKAGLADFFMGHGEGRVKFIGHRLGLEIDELSIIAPFFDRKLEPGMVVAFEPKFVFPGRGVAGTDDDYGVTSSGLERLTMTEQELIRI
jgi:Xaa-Pro aminopeptidase